MKSYKEFHISPDLKNDRLTKEIDGINEAGETIKLPVVNEVPLTIYLNKQEIVTAMTLGDATGSRTSTCTAASRGASTSRTCRRSGPGSRF